MNRKLIVSILAILLVIAMLLSLVLAALPANVFAASALLKPAAAPVVPLCAAVPLL